MSLSLSLCSIILPTKHLSQSYYNNELISNLYLEKKACSLENAANFDFFSDTESHFPAESPDGLPTRMSFSINLYL